ncbi:MAG: TrkH family potassium uptake protein [Gloeomargarita sp. SKYG116]|nr:TrkH family potassium uptake protein [Gloeomargarita sp. SKYG116]MCS7225980.1 TrkH family potassium uptake protein [Gloeomargarita sp. SKYB31]MDW8402097.1 TrkH family potassium uptake protein [Gloeomargarita sp. SKYGB_i_bin116]
MTPARTICLGFLLVISMGMLLLLGPWATQTHQWSDPVTALFTATSAVCVTGLSVVDVGTYYSLLGQIILLLLVQIGGLGYMTSMTLLFMALGRRFRLKDKLAIQHALDQSGIGGIQGLLRLILAATVVMETIGALVLWSVFRREYGWGRGLWLAIFHSVSAFNNAGFSLFPDSLMRYQQSGPVVGVISVLIMLGGIGYPVLSDLWHWFRRRQPVSLNTKVVVTTSLFLWLVGTLLFWAVEARNPATLGQLPFSGQLWAAWFHAVTPRTAGFNTIDVGKMTVTGLVITMVLMFIGASPGGTGGGIKTTTVRVLVRATRAILRGHDEVIIYEREIPPVLIYKAIAVLIGSLGVVMVMVTLLSLTEANQDHGFLALLFEVVSAFGTVGLSTGITSQLTFSGKLFIILTMYVGRIGVLLLMAAIVSEPRPLRTHYPEETFLVG